MLNRAFLDELKSSPLALDGGEPIRVKPLPQEWCGAHHIDEREIDAVARVLRSASLFRYYGLDLQNETESFEKEFAEYTGIRYALGVASGTAALQVALGAMGIGPGDEVLVPGYFWVATVGAVVRAGAIPVLVDVDDTFSMDPDKLEESITPRTKAILPVHMGGVIGRVGEMVDCARKHGLAVLEDCAQACGASQNGVRAGAFGDVGIFSFQYNKNITAGEGGMVVMSDRGLADRAMAAHDLGYPRGDDGRLIVDDPKAQLWGIGCRMSELTAAVMRVQLSKVETICEHMRSAKYRIREAIADIPGITPRKVPDPTGDSGGFLYLSFETPEISQRFVEALKAEGIVVDAGGMYPVHMTDWGLHIYHHIPSLVHKRGISAVSPWDLAENAESSVSYEKGTCPNLDSLVERTVIMCVASNLQESDVDDIIAALVKVAAHVL